MLTIGIVGLPNSGKSTLFNALLKRQPSFAEASEGRQAVDLSTEAPKGAKVENRPFTTIEPNVGVVAVPDPRLEQLATIAKPTEVIPATVEFVDIAGLVKGANEGVGLGNQFLSHIREVDAILLLLRAFSDPNVVHVEGKVDPENDLEILLLELELADEAHPEAPKLLGKPRLIVYNVDETELVASSTSEVKGSHTPEVSPAGLKVSAKLEAELSSLDAVDQQAFLTDLGLEAPPLDRVISEAYRLLTLITFYTTTGGRIIQAWSLRAGATALEAAGTVHTEMGRGFIRAEVVSFTDFIAHQGEPGLSPGKAGLPAGKAGLPPGKAGAKAAGKLRTEGKEYVVQDGDVMHFRFNV